MTSSTRRFHSVGLSGATCLQPLCTMTSSPKHPGHWGMRDWPQSTLTTARAPTAPVLSFKTCQIWGSIAPKTSAKSTAPAPPTRQSSRPTTCAVMVCDGPTIARDTHRTQRVGLNVSCAGGGTLFGCSPMLLDVAPPGPVGASGEPRQRRPPALPKPPPNPGAPFSQLRVVPPTRPRPSFAPRLPADDLCLVRRSMGLQGGPPRLPDAVLRVRGAFRDFPMIPPEPGGRHRQYPVGGTQGVAAIGRPLAA